MSIYIVFGYTEMIEKKINFSRLVVVNVIDCFELFDLRRTINKSGIIEPIEPFNKIEYEII